jgi:hypothetical protein
LAQGEQIAPGEALLRQLAQQKSRLRSLNHERDPR